MNWGTFFSVFALVFVAELGDKTQLAVVAQTCKYRKPWAVFLGASAALAVVTGIGVVGGQLLGRLIPQGVVRAVAALGFVIMGLIIARDARNGADEVWDENACAARSGTPADGCAGRASTSVWSWQAFAASFGLLFAAELGDKTQLAVLSLSSEHGEAQAVLAGAALALTLVTALGVVGGRVLCRRVPQRVILWVSALVFIVLGALMGFSVL
jgi:putative Ca2+/H+ antiporter (TMEM165/GDT1 family)